MFTMLPPKQPVSPRRRMRTTFKVPPSESEVSSSSISESVVSPPSSVMTLHCEQLTPELVMRKVNAVRLALERDLLACDAKWTLFVAAALSYRYDTMLRPFPPRYVSEQTGLNIDALASVINETPKLGVIQVHLREQNYHEVNADVLLLLYWVLVEMREPCLRPLSEDEFDERLATLTTQPNLLQRPTHVFEILPRTQLRPPGYHLATITEATSSDTAQSDLASELDLEECMSSIEVGFYGCRLDEFYSLLNFGFPTSATNTEQKPLVLQRELNAAMSKSPNGAGWGASACGSLIACVAMCICTDAPPQLLERKAGRRGVELVVHSPELVQPRFLLFYGSRTTDQNRTGDMLKAVTRWMTRHKYIITVSYTLVITSIILSNHGHMHAMRDALNRKMKMFIDYLHRHFVVD